jgi:putative NADH-flavin reductase
MLNVLGRGLGPLAQSCIIECMKIAVIAANGRSGRAFVAAALVAGHAVRAGGRGASKLPAHERLEVIKCDATQSDDVRRLLVGQEAVVSLIGHVKGSPKDVQATATLLAAEAMRELSVRRIVSLTGTGVRLPQDRITLADRVLNWGISVIDVARVRDGQRHAEILKASDLDWTIIRVLKLANGKSQPFRLTPHGPTKLFVSRDEVARAILEVLEQHTYLSEMPIISAETSG